VGVSLADPCRHRLERDGLWAALQKNFSGRFQCDEATFLRAQTTAGQRAY